MRKNYNLNALKEKRFYRITKFSFNYLFGLGKNPDFIIAGVQKGGTSFLNKNLRHHPQIEICPNLSEKRDYGLNIKEAHFFDTKKNFKKGIRWYRSIFNKNFKLQGDITPDYFCRQSYLTRIKIFLKENVKIILILRDPVDRAYSHFNHFRSGERLKKKLLVPEGNFEENIDAEIKKGFPKQRLISKGFYSNHLLNIFSLFKKENVLILISEESKKNPLKILNKICDFLDIQYFEKCVTKENHSRKYSELISKSAEKKLYEIYKPYNKKLFKILGYRIKEWENH